MMRLKSCPRCHGDVVIESDYHGWYEHCLQCGYEHDLPAIMGTQPRVRPVEPPAGRPDRRK